MKLKAIALGVALAFPMMASAQSSTSVTLYGTIDTAVEYVNKIPEVTPTGIDHKSSFHFTNLTGSVPSNWGLRGVEDLGNGLSAVFKLESGFNPGTGQSGQGGRLFGREAWVGLKGDFGQISFGRQYNMLLFGLMQADVLGPTAYGLGSIDAYIPNARNDNAISYYGVFNGFKIGAQYARGRDNSLAGGPAGRGCVTDYRDNSACSAWSAVLGYDAPNWGVAAAYDQIRGTDLTLPAALGGLGPDDKDRRWTINGYVKFDALKVGLIYLNRKNDAGIGIGLGERSDLWTLNAAYQVSPAVTIDGSVNYIRYKDGFDPATGFDRSSKAWYYVARATYSLSKRTAVYASASYMNNKGSSNLSAAGGTAGLNPGMGENQTAVMAGLRHRF